MKYLALFLAAGLCACSGNGKTGKTEETMQQTTADVPSRKAYEGFEWERVTGAGLHIPEHTRSLSGSLLGYKTIP